MIDGVEGIGELVTGGMLAQTIEPEAGSSHAGHGETCLNCGAALQGDFCHKCGQAGHVHRTLGAFGHDIAHSVFHFDGKMFRTLPLLAWHPGELTRRYIEGERAKFVSPMAIFLFSVFLMFAVISAFGGPFHAGSADADRADATADYRKDRAETLKELANLRKERARLVAAGEPTTDVDVDIRTSQAELALEERLYKAEIARAAAQEKREADQEAREKAAKGKPAPPPQAAAAGEKTGNEVTDELIDVNTGVPAIDKAIEKAKANPSLLLYKLQSNAYKFSWALIPISVPFVWLMFLHRRRYWKYKAYDHIVFVTYSITFMSIGFIVLTLLKPLGAPEAIAGLAIAFGPPIHMYRQLRGAYQLSRFSALWRTFLLLNFAFVAASLFFVLLLALGVLG